MTLYRGEYSARDTYRICRCPLFQYPSTWRDNDLWTQRFSDLAPLPPSCVDCGGWPAWRDRVCAWCKRRFYFYFIHPNQRAFPNEVCWTCCKIVDPPEKPIYDRRMKPREELFPKPTTVKEMMEALYR